jgi:bifunctional non-homologous end joining protein LigD
MTAAKAAKAAPVDVCGVKVTSPDRVVYRLDGQGLTKLDVARYIARVAPLMLPHVRGRPISVVRCHGGSDGPGFFQKHVIKGMPAQIHAIDVVERKGTNANLTVHDAAGLVGLVQMSALEFHTWCSKEDDTETPDRFIIDLDPGTDLPWQRVVDAARTVREMLTADGLESFVKTTGGKGLHIIAPLERASWSRLARYAEQFATKMQEREPDKYTTNMMKKQRVGKIFIDFVRNMRGSTIVAPWSMRKSGAVSVPIAWEELDDVRGSTWTLVNIEPRLKANATSDPWRRFFEVRQRLPSRDESAPQNVGRALAARSRRGAT